MVSSSKLDIWTYEGLAVWNVAEDSVVSFNDWVLVWKHINQDLRPIHNECGCGLSCQKCTCEIFHLHHKK